MSQYRIVGTKQVEINGKLRKEDEILDESEFKLKPADAPEEELSELESLLKSGHVVEE